ncbi:MAG TPA: SDR family NAD(P)-dependent oxidoreductase, partial [Candidatus Sulfotelmatobacter sp.]|nr:SDR family NAD(P)-dependent oxidoreductase [Candidatus Sulfotelmatobacter sp.]
MKRGSIAERAVQFLSLEGKVAMVTGAASGIGRGISIRLAEMGAFVAVLDIDETRGREVAAEIEGTGGATSFLKCDVRSAGDCRRAVESIIQRAGRIDIL